MAGFAASSSSKKNYVQTPAKRSPSSAAWDSTWRCSRATIRARQGPGLKLGVPVVAGLLPEDKVAAVKRARHEFGPVAMVGDGSNDAPALARSDIGIALGCGADVSRNSADVCLTGNDLLRLPWTIAAGTTNRVRHP